MHLVGRSFPTPLAPSTCNPARCRQEWATMGCLWVAYQAWGLLLLVYRLCTCNNHKVLVRLWCSTRVWDPLCSAHIPCHHHSNNNSSSRWPWCIMGMVSVLLWPTPHGVPQVWVCLQVQSSCSPQGFPPVRNR